MPSQEKDPSTLKEQPNIHKSSATTSVLKIQSFLETPLDEEAVEVRENGREEKEVGKKEDKRTLGDVKKLDRIINMMKGIVDKKNEIKDKEKSKPKKTEFSDVNIEQLVRKIVVETLAQSRMVPEIVLEEEKKKNLNALDTILENIFLDKYTESVNLNEEMPDNRNLPATQNKETKKTTLKNIGNENSVEITDELIDRLVESLYPIVTQATDDSKKALDKMSKNEEDQDEKEDDFEAVQKALAFLIGENPSEEEKLSPEVLPGVYLSLHWLSLPRFLLLSLSWTSS